MRLNHTILISISCVLVALLSGCASNNREVQSFEDQQETAPAAQMMGHHTPHIVHIDLFERIATIRNGVALGGDFLIVKNYAGVETGVLKVRPSSSLTLVTADILEGHPKINNTIETADTTRSIELSKLYSIASE